MSKAQRIEARNARIKQRQAEQKSKEPPTKKEFTQEEVKTRLEILKQTWNEAQKKTQAFIKLQEVDEDAYVDFEAALYLKKNFGVVEKKSSNVLRFMPAKTIDGKTREAHFAGPDSTAINKEYQKHKLAETKAQNAYFAYRSQHDKEWIKIQEENQAKINLFKTVLGTKALPPHPKKKVFEIIHKMHSNPFDTSSFIVCKHYDRDTWDYIECDCEKTYRCGCVETLVCRVHNVSLCDCTYRILSSLFTKCALHIEDQTFSGSSDVVNFKPSLRASAKLAQNKLSMANFGGTKIKIARTCVGLILVKNKNGTMNEQSVRCYHCIIPTGDALPCDCYRDENNQLQLSQKMRELPEADVIVDETCLKLQRQVVDRAAVDQECMMNPLGLAGTLRPEVGPVHPLKRLQEKAMLAEAEKLQLFV